MSLELLKLISIIVSWEITRYLSIKRYQLHTTVFFRKKYLKWQFRRITVTRISHATFAVSCACKRRYYKCNYGTFTGLFRSYFRPLGCWRALYLITCARRESRRGWRLWKTSITFARSSSLPRDRSIAVFLSTLDLKVLVTLVNVKPGKNSTSSFLSK